MDKKSPAFFEQWARENNMTPVGRFACDDGDILIADSEEAFFGKTDTGVVIKFWRTGFSIFRDRNWIASTTDTLVEDLAAYTQMGARQYRIEEALQYARKTLQMTVDAGLYDDGRQESFSTLIH